MAIDPDEYDFEDYDPLDERSVDPIRRSRAVRWTAILIVASFALAGLSSLSQLVVTRPQATPSFSAMCAITARCSCCGLNSTISASASTRTV